MGGGEGEGGEGRVGALGMDLRLMLILASETVPNMSFCCQFPYWLARSLGGEPELGLAWCWLALLGPMTAGYNAASVLTVHH